MIDVLWRTVDFTYCLLLKDLCDFEDRCDLKEWCDKRLERSEGLVYVKDWCDLKHTV